MRSLSAFTSWALSIGLALAALGASRRVAAAVEPAGASAAEGGLHIESTTCAHPLVEEVQHLARVELISAGLPEGEDAPRVFLSCSGRVALIRALLGNGGQDSRQLDLAQTDEALQARVIALAIAELVRDTASRGAPPPAAVPSNPVARVDVAPTPPPVEPLSESKNRLVAFGKVANFGAHLQPLVGGGLGFSHDLGRFALGLGPSLVVSKSSSSLGAVNVLMADLSVRLSLRFPGRILASEVGVGHALGLAHLKGSSDSALTDASSVSGIWAAPFLFGGCEAELGGPMFLQLGAELGIVTVPVRGYVARDSDVGAVGVWGGLSLGIGLNL